MRKPDAFGELVFYLKRCRLSLSPVLVFGLLILIESDWSEFIELVVSEAVK